MTLDELLRTARAQFERHTSQILERLEEVCIDNDCDDEVIAEVLATQRKALEEFWVNTIEPQVRRAVHGFALRDPCPPPTTLQ